MKKTLFYAFMAAAMASTFTLTSCGGDDDEDDEYNFSDYQSLGKSSLSLATGKGGAYTYFIKAGDINASLLSLQAIDLYTYNATGPEAFGNYDEDGMYMGQSSQWKSILFGGTEETAGFFGGFCPASFTYDDDNYGYNAPIDQSTGEYLITVGGSFCKAIFCKHFDLNATEILSSTMSLTKGKYIKSMDICLPRIYEELELGEGKAEWSIDYTDFSGNEVEKLPANSKIVLYVRSYIESLNVSNLDNLKKTVQTLVSGVQNNTFTKEVAITLADVDKDGKVTLNDKVKTWNTIDLTSLNKGYVFEVYMTVVDNATGKEHATYTMPEDLNKILVKNIKFLDK